MKRRPASEFDTHALWLAHRSRFYRGIVVQHDAAAT
jgi:hypothetical protein